MNSQPLPENEVSAADNQRLGAALVEVFEAIQEQKLAAAMYTEYCQAVGGKAHNGDILPDWKTFSEDPYKQLQSQGWVAAAKRAIAFLAPAPAASQP